jgi:hypothetical protein
MDRTSQERLAELESKQIRHPPPDLTSNSSGHYVDDIDCSYWLEKSSRDLFKACARDGRGVYPETETTLTFDSPR